MSILNGIRDNVISHFKTEAVKIAMVKIFGKVLPGGLKAWLVKFIVEYLFDEAVNPGIKLIFRKIGYVNDRAKGEFKLKKIEEAKNENNSDKYFDTIDDI